MTRRLLAYVLPLVACLAWGWLVAPLVAGR